MAPKGNKGKKTVDSSGDPVYAQKRAKNNEVRQSFGLLQHFFLNNG